MKKPLLALLLLLSAPCLHAIHRVDSLLNLLDGTIAGRQVYTDRKEARIRELILEKPNCGLSTRCTGLTSR